MSHAATPSSQVRSELLHWAAGGDWSKVTDHLPSWLEEAEDSARLALGRLCLQARQWALGLRALDRVEKPDAGVPLQRRLAANLVAFEQHHPQAYEILIQTVDPCQYQLAQVDPHRWAVVQKTPEGQTLPHGPAPERIPDAALVPLQNLIEQNHLTGCGIALCGMGDGALLRQLVKHHWKVWGHFHVEPMLWLVEPDVGLVLHQFMIDDYAQPDGPILRGNCRWLLGPQWPMGLMEQLQCQPTLRFPQVKIPQGRLGKSLIPEIEALAQRQAMQLEKRRDDIWRRYPALEMDLLVALLGDQPPRRPRVLFITSRLTTVLQYANQDCQRAFAEMGWETRLLIEPSAYEDTTPAYLLEELAAFEPDVVFMIDSLRLHASMIFPPPVLHVCWVQDDLPRLINKEAGQSIGPRDFVALPAGPWYARRFDYPLGQCLFLDKLTNVCVPARPAVADGDDLIFVTNAGRTPEKIQQEILREYGQVTAMMRELLDLVTADMLKVYQQGGHLHSPAQVRALIQRTQERQGWTLRQNTAVDQCVTLLFNRFNNTLYRQQVVRWLIEIARRQGLTLSLYGAGWSENPEFADYARGSVAYGRALEELTARSKINLQVVPFGCMHQRLLDGLASGGFFLVREHPWDRLLPTVWALVRDQIQGDWSRGHLEAVLPGLAPARQQKLRELAGLYRLIYDDTDDDPVRRCRDMIESGCDFMLEPFPAMDQTFFTTPAQLENQVRTYLQNPALRREIQAQQAAYVRENLTYRAGLSRLMRQIRARLMQAQASRGEGPPMPVSGEPSQCA